MPSGEARLAAVEAQVQDHSQVLGEVRDAIRHLEQRVDARFQAIDARFDAIDQRFDAIDQRFDAIDRRFDAHERRFEANDRHFEALERRLDRLDDKMARQFMWTVSIQITVLLAVVSAFAAMMGIVLSRV